MTRSDRDSLAQAESVFPGLYEQLMDFYPYSVLFDGPDGSENGSISPVLALRLAAEFLQSIPEEPPAPDISALKSAVITAGYEVRRSSPPFRRLVRRTTRPVRGHWGWTELRMEEARRLSTGRGVKLAIVDTGLDPTLKDIRGQVVDYRDFLTGERPFWGKRRFPYDWGGHGTAIASVIAQAAPGAKLLIARAYDEESMERVPGNWWTLNLLEAGIAWAVESGADVINLSFAVHSDVARMRTLVRRCWEKNVILVASVGNVFEPADAGSTFYPAAYPWPIAVGGVEKNGDKLRVWDHSGGGNYLDIVAPAASIWVEQPSYLDQRGSPHRAYGNSLATAMVSGSVALVLAAMDDEVRQALKRKPGALCDTVREIICGTASNEKLGLERFNPRSGYGLIDPVRAIEEAKRARRH